MKPPVVAVGKFKGKLIILKIILSDIHIEAVRRNVVERFTRHFFLFATFAFSVNVACLNQFFF